jgi:hypothetical protein
LSSVISFSPKIERATGSSMQILECKILSNAHTTAVENVVDVVTLLLLKRSLSCIDTKKMESQHLCEVFAPDCFEPISAH